MSGRAGETLAPDRARALALHLLEARGFHVTAQNERRDTHYLAIPGATCTLRLSNHARRPKQRRTHPEVATSLVIREPRSPAQVERLVDAATATYAARADTPSLAILLPSSSR